MDKMIDLAEPSCAMRSYGFKSQADAEACASQRYIIGCKIIASVVVMVILLMYFTDQSTMPNFAIVLVMMGGIMAILYPASQFAAGQEWKKYEARRQAYVARGKTPDDAFQTVINEAQSESEGSALSTIADAIKTGRRV